MSWLDVLVEILRCLTGLDKPTRRAHRQDLHKGKTDPLDLDLQCLLHHSLRPRHVGVRVDRAARGIRDPGEPRDEVADDDWIAMLLSRPSVKGVLGALAEWGSRSHVPPGLAEHT